MMIGRSTFVNEFCDTSASLFPSLNSNHVNENEVKPFPSGFETCFAPGTHEEIHLKGWVQNTSQNTIVGAVLKPLNRVSVLMCA